MSTNSQKILPLLSMNLPNCAYESTRNKKIAQIVLLLFGYFLIILQAGCGTSSSYQRPIITANVVEVPTFGPHDSQTLVDFLKQERTLYRTLYSELGTLDLSNTEQFSVIGEYCYYSQTQAGLRFPLVFQARLDSQRCLKDTSTVFLDLNNFKFKDSSLEGIRINSDGTKVALLISESLDKLPALYIFDRATKKLTTLSTAVHDAIWCSKEIVFSRINDQLRPYEIAKGRENSKIISTVYREQNPIHHLTLSKSKDENFIFITSDAVDSNEVFILPCKSPSDLIRFKHREFGVKLSLDHVDGEFFISESSPSKEEKLFHTPTASIDPSSWSEIALQGILVNWEAYIDYLITVVKNDKGLTIKVIDRRNYAERELVLHDNAVNIRPVDNYNDHSTKYNFCVTRLRSPSECFELDLATLRLTKTSEELVRGPSSFRSIKLEDMLDYVKTNDDQSVPITLLFTRNSLPGPMILHVYGSYGTQLDQSFRTERLPLLKRGVNFAFCHVRGSGGFGSRWVEAGRRGGKILAIEDLLACANYLISNKASTKGKILLEAKSAGALVAAQALNLAPELFAGIILDQPFLEPIRRLSNDSLPLTERDKDEWGDPNNSSELNILTKISPLLNIKQTIYPPALVTVSEWDREVGVQDGIEWAQKVAGASPNHVLLRYLTDGNHSGPATKHRVLEELSLKYSFALSSLKNTPK